MVFSALLVMTLVVAPLPAARPTDSTASAPDIRDDLWINLGMVPLYAFLQLNIHEGSHAAAAVAFGNSITDYRPYPHIVYYEVPDGPKKIDCRYEQAPNGNVVERCFITQPTRQESEAYVGSVWTKGEMTPQEEAWTLAAPMLSNLTLFAAADLSLSFIPHESYAALPVLIAGMICPWVDFTYNMMYSRSRHSDTRRIAQLTGTDIGTMRAVGFLIATVGMVRILHRGGQIIAASPDPREDAMRISFHPQLISDGFGIGMTLIY